MLFPEQHSITTIYIVLVLYKTLYEIYKLFKKRMCGLYSTMMPSHIKDLSVRGLSIYGDSETVLKYERVAEGFCLFVLRFIRVLIYIYVCGS